MKGNFGRTGVIKAISIIPREHPAQERGKQTWENQRRIRTLRDDLKMWGEKYKFSQREFFPPAPKRHFGPRQWPE
jgi:hypothetical protein